MLKMIERKSADPRNGSLCVAEAASESVPFDINRVYYIYGVQRGVQRGAHAHKTLKQVLICVHGRIEISLDDGRGNVQTTVLNEPSDGLYVGPGMWRTMKWLQDDSVLLVLASEHYNEADYIRDYDEFIEYGKRRS
ncbi:sugar 3,4-ketoisomerase [Pyramidobacter porci]